MINKLASRPTPAANSKIVNPRRRHSLTNANGRLTNTTGGVVPITRLGDRPIGNGKKGDLTAQLSHAFEALVRNHG